MNEETAVLEAVCSAKAEPQPLAIIDPGASQPVACTTLAELKMEIGAYWRELMRHGALTVYATVSAGAAILLYSERPEVQEQAKAANKGKLGRPFTPAGYVVHQLSLDYPDELPSYKHLLACARAAEIARSRGVLDKGMRRLLGWNRPGAEESAESMPAVEPARIARGLAAGQPRTRRQHRGPYELYALKRMAAIHRAAMELAGNLPKGFRWLDHPKEAEAFAQLRDSINSYLTHLRLALVDATKGHRG